MASEMNLGMKCIKYMLLTVNAMFLLTATLILSIGTTIYAIYQDFQDFITDGFFSPAALLIVIGIIMFAVSIFGCLGAAKESTCMINVFALMLSLIFILEIAAGLVAYTSIGGVKHIVTEKFNHTMQVYHKSIPIRQSVDLVQEKLACCGIDGREDWIYTPWFHQQPENATRSYPNSCYPSKNELETYEDGCMYGVTNIITQSAILLGTGAMTIAFIQLIGIIFSIMLGKAIRQAKTERERRRWEIREQMINAYNQMEVHRPKKPENNTPVIYIPTIGNSHV